EAEIEPDAFEPVHDAVIVAGRIVNRHPVGFELRNASHDEILGDGAATLQRDNRRGRGSAGAVSLRVRGAGAIGAGRDQYLVHAVFIGGAGVAVTQSYRDSRNGSA